MGRATTGRATEPDRWIAAAGRAAGTKSASKFLNAYLDNLQAKVYEAHRQVIETNHLLTAETIKNRFLGREETVAGGGIPGTQRKVAALVEDEFTRLPKALHDLSEAYAGIHEVEVWVL
ncbi:hypothetical protein [Pontibacter sp. HJ8]